MFSTPNILKAVKTAAALIFVADNDQNPILIMDVGAFIKAAGEYLHKPNPDAQLALRLLSATPDIVKANHHVALL